MWLLLIALWCSTREVDVARLSISAVKINANIEKPPLGSLRAEPSLANCLLVPCIPFIISQIQFWGVNKDV